MSRRAAFRIAGAIMLSLAAAFAVCAAVYPEFGITIHIGGCNFSLDSLRGSHGLHAAYAAVMAALFAASFFARGGSPAE